MDVIRVRVKVCFYRRLPHRLHVICIQPLLKGQGIAATESTYVNNVSLKIIIKKKNADCEAMEIEVDIPTIQIRIYIRIGLRRMFSKKELR